MKKSLIYLMCLTLLFTVLCGCRQSADTPPAQTEASIDAPNKREKQYTYEEYCAMFPAFAECAAKDTELYWTIDKTDEASGKKIAAIHCQNENEAYTLFQIGNAFWRYAYSEIYMGVASKFKVLSVGSETFYAFNMCRFFSSGGFFVEDLLLISPNRADKIYSVTVENAYEAVAQKIDIKYSENAQELTVRDSRKTTILPLASKKTSAYEDGFVLEKTLKFADLFLQFDFEDEKNYCWGYEIEGDKLYIETVVFANYHIADDTPNGYWDYHEEYEWIGEVRTQVLFDGETISFGDAVFTPD